MASMGEPWLGKCWEAWEAWDGGWLCLETDLARAAFKVSWSLFSLERCMKLLRLLTNDQRSVTLTSMLSLYHMLIRFYDL